jgi:hypothetical protein
MSCSYIAANQPVERPMSDADSNKIVLADETHEVSDTADHGALAVMFCSTSMNNAPDNTGDETSV